MLICIICVGYLVLLKYFVMFLVLKVINYWFVGMKGKRKSMILIIIVVFYG